MTLTCRKRDRAYYRCDGCGLSKAVVDPTAKRHRPPRKHPILDRLDGPNPPRLVVIDPRVTEPARRAAVHLAPRPGTNLPLLNGLLHLMIRNDHVERTWVDEHTAGFGDLEKIASAKGCAPSQVALAWLLAQGEGIVPIPGTKRRTYLESNVAAADLELTAVELAALDAAFPRDAASGERYAPEHLRWIDRSK